jgi:hypothetical protein
MALRLEPSTSHNSCSSTCLPDVARHASDMSSGNSVFVYRKLELSLFFFIFSRESQDNLWIKPRQVSSKSCSIRPVFGVYIGISAYQTPGCYFISHFEYSLLCELMSDFQLLHFNEYFIFFYTLVRTVHLHIIKIFYSPTDGQVNCLKNNFKIYIKIDIKTAPTYFGEVTPSSGSALLVLASKHE